MDRQKEKKNRKEAVERVKGGYAIEIMLPTSKIHT